MISLAILEKPVRRDGRTHKGAVILSDLDKVCLQFPEIKKYFYTIERRGWRGINEAELADIKLVEDLSTMDETKRRFPNSILLDIGPADFVDTEVFHPVKAEKKYTGIQISLWEPFKRHELFVRAASLIPEKRFLKFGHFLNGGTLEERTYRTKVIKLSKDLGASIDILFSDFDSNKGLPKEAWRINEYINQCRMGILTTKVEGINRFKMECLAANIPVLVPADTSYPTLKHINEHTGYAFEPTPVKLAEAILYVESNLHKFKPRNYVLVNTGKEKSLEKLRKALYSLCIRDNQVYHFQDITWDGRNPSLLWEEKAVQEIQSTIRGIK